MTDTSLAILVWTAITIGVTHTVIGPDHYVPFIAIARARRGHGHRHLPGGGHLDEHEGRSVTFWALFLVFVFGPCEPLIPLLMFPAVKHDWAGVWLVTGAFGVATVGTMCLLVTAGVRGLARVRGAGLERYAHALAGGIIALSGAAIRLFGI